MKKHEAGASILGLAVVGFVLFALAKRGSSVRYGRSRLAAREATPRPMPIRDEAPALPSAIEEMEIAEPARIENFEESPALLFPDLTAEASFLPRGEATPPPMPIQDEAPASPSAVEEFVLPEAARIEGFAECPTLLFPDLTDEASLLPSGEATLPPMPIQDEAPVSPSALEELVIAEPAWIESYTGSPALSLPDLTDEASFLPRGEATPPPMPIQVEAPASPSAVKELVIAEPAWIESYTESPALQLPDLTGEASFLPHGEATPPPMPIPDEAPASPSAVEELSIAELAWIESFTESPALMLPGLTDEASFLPRGEATPPPMPIQDEAPALLSAVEELVIPELAGIESFTETLALLLPDLTGEASFLPRGEATPPPIPIPDEAPASPSAVEELVIPEPATTGNKALSLVAPSEPLAGKASSRTSLKSTGLISRAWNWARARQSARFNPRRLQVAETVSLGDKRFVSVIRIDGLQFLIGGGGTNVALLTQLPGKEPFGQLLQEAMTVPAKQNAELPVEQTRRRA